MTFGPTLFVDIGLDLNYQPRSRRVPSPSIQHIHALVDTGSAQTCIDNVLAAQLGLPILDKWPISGVHGKHLSNIYIAQIHVPALKFTIHGQFAGVDLAAGGQIHKVLIGRTFLQHFTMVYEGITGAVALFKDI